MGIATLPRADTTAAPAAAVQLSLTTLTIERPPNG